MVGLFYFHRPIVRELGRLELVRAFDGWSLYIAAPLSTYYKPVFSFHFFAGDRPGSMCCAKQPVKSNMLVVMALFLLLCCSTVPGNSSDMLALLDFKQAIANDPGLILSNWNTSTPYCHWAGVSCRSRTHIDRVTALELAGQSLTGTLSPSLGNLTFLRTLNLSVNHFSGHLPDLSHLHRLELLDLKSNSLQGIIPDTLTNCSNLRELQPVRFG